MMLKEYVSSSLGATVDRLRRERGLGWKELSERGGVSLGYLRRIDWAGRWNPRLDTLEGVCLGLGVRVSYLFGEASGSLPEESLSLPYRPCARLGRYFGRAVRLMRKRSGLSLLEAGDRCGVCKENMCHVENHDWERRNPTAEYLHLISYGVGVGLEELVWEMEWMALEEGFLYLR